MRLTVFRMLLGVAIAAILLHFLSDWMRNRRERLLQLADRHARIGAEYHDNAGGNLDMLRIAAWHERMRREFERAAAHPWELPPSSQPFPPKRWNAPPPNDVARR
jgi:hypothetical protein